MWSSRRWRSIPREICWSARDTGRTRCASSSPGPARHRRDTCQAPTLFGPNLAQTNIGQPNVPASMAACPCYAPNLQPLFFIKVCPHDQSQRAPDVKHVGGNESGRRDDYGDPIPVIRTSNSLAAHESVKKGGGRTLFRHRGLPFSDASKRDALRFRRNPLDKNDRKWTYQRSLLRAE